MIKQHNPKILNKAPNQQQKPGNCKCKESCPLKGNCQAHNIVCKATVATLKNYRIYYRTSEGEFDIQFNNGNHSGIDKRLTKQTCQNTSDS